jgi:nucleoside-diphosphate-sugar epimerase
VTRFEDVMAAFATYKPDIVLNFGFMRENLPRVAMKLNVYGADNCFEAARLCDVRRVVFASSIAVNGGQDNYGQRAIREADPVHPRKQYDVHKVFNEWQANEYREKHGMSIIGIRAANVSGEDKLIGSVDHVACIVKPALGQKVTLDFRDRMRCVIYGDDAAEGFVRVALAPNPRHSIYNSGGESLSLGQIAEMTKRFLPEGEIEFENDLGGEERSGAYLFDNSLILAEFGLVYMPYEQRIGAMIENIRRNAATA